MIGSAILMVMCGILWVSEYRNPVNKSWSKKKRAFAATCIVLLLVLSGFLLDFLVSTIK